MQLEFAAKNFNADAIITTPKARRTTYRSLTLVHPMFAWLTLLPRCQNPMLYNAFQSVKYHKSAPSRGGIYIPAYVPWTHPTQYFKLHLSSAVFGQLTAESPCALERD